MPIKYGSTDVDTLYFGGALVPQAYMATVPLLDSGQPVFPPVTDQLVEYIDAGVAASWDDIGSVLNDLEPTQGNNNYDNSGGNGLVFNGAVGARANDTYFEITSNFDYMFAQTPFSDIQNLHWNDHGQWTIVMVMQMPAGVGTSKIVGNGSDSLADGWRYEVRSAGLYYRARTGSSNRRSTTYTVDENVWNVSYPRVITLAGDSSDSGAGFVKVSGFPKVFGRTDHTNTTQVAGGGNQIGGSLDVGPVGARFYAFMYYRKILSDVEITQIEDFFLNYVAPPAVTLGVIGVENIGISNGGSGNNQWRIYELAPITGGVPQYGALAKITKDSWLNIDNVDDQAFNTYAESVNDMATPNQMGMFLDFQTPQTPEALGIYQNDSRRSAELLSIKGSDDGGASSYEISQARLFYEPKSYENSNELRVIPLPTTEMMQYSVKVRSILARWPNMTPTELSATATFLTSLETAGVIDFIDEMFPLYMTNEQDSITSSHRCGKLSPQGTVSHVPGIGWSFPGGNGNCLIMQDLPGDYMRYPLSNGTSGRNRGATVFVYDRDDDNMNSQARLWGMRDDSTTNRYYELYHQLSNARFLGRIATTSTNNTGSGSYYNIPKGEPISWWRKDNNHWFKWWTDPDVNAGSVGGTSVDLDASKHSIAIGGYNSQGSLINSFAGVMSIFIHFDLSQLANTVFDDIHAAIIQLMDDLGIRDGHTPLETFGDDIVSGYPQPLEDFEATAIKNFANYIFNSNTLQGKTPEVYLPCLTNKENADHPMFGNAGPLGLELAFSGTGQLPTHQPGRGYRIRSTADADGGYLITPYGLDTYAALVGGNALGFGSFFTDYRPPFGTRNMSYWGMKDSGASQRHQLRWQMGSNRHQIYPWGSSTTNWSNAPGNEVFVNDYVFTGSHNSTVHLDRALADDTPYTATQGGGYYQDLTERFGVGAFLNQGSPSEIFGQDIVVSIVSMHEPGNSGERTETREAFRNLINDLGLILEFNPITDSPDYDTAFNDSGLDTGWALNGTDHYMLVARGTHWVTHIDNPVSADVEYEVTWKLPPAPTPADGEGNNNFHMIVRYTDDNNFIAMRLQDDQWLMQERFGGVYSTAITAAASADDVGKQVILRAIGDQASLVVDGITVLNFTTQVLAAGKFGMNTFGSGSQRGLIFSDPIRTEL